MATQLVNTDLDFNNVGRITNLPDAVSSQQPVTLAQLNAAIEATSWKDAARVATQGNLSLSSPGATIDGITMVSGDRVLVKAQSTASQNGIYIWNGAATPMTRAPDASTTSELEQAVLPVEEGTDAGTIWRQNSINFTIDSGAITWVSAFSSTPDASETTAGKAEIATQTEVNTGVDDARIVTPAKLASWSGRPLKFSANIGDGSATSIAVTHNLNTLDVQVYVRETGGNVREVMCEKRHTSVNQVTLIFNTAPASNAYRVTILG